MKKIKLVILGLTVFSLSLSLYGCASIGDEMGSVFSPVAVTLTSPANGAANVPIDVVVKASFNEASNALSFNRSTFLLIGPRGEKIKGTVYYNPNSLTNYIVTFTPAEPLMPNTEYTAELTTGIMGNLKQHLAKPYIWRFTTGG